MNPSNATQVSKNKTLQRFTLRNANGLRCELTNYGARIVGLWVLDREGKMDNVVLGYDELEDYLEGKEWYLGATVGRFANRIANARFEVEGEEYSLDQNEGEHHLHGGYAGWHAEYWEAEQLSESAVQFSLVSPDGAGGYPGTVQAFVRYQLTEQNALKIYYLALTDKTTPLSLTNHAYFNLAGTANNSVADHRLLLVADAITAVDEDALPTGELLPVEGTRFDFNQEKAIGPLKPGGRFDHNYVLSGKGFRPVARVREPGSGRSMTVMTNKPGMQFFVTDQVPGKRGESGNETEKRAAFCLETQHFPDSPNQPDFPDCLLRPGEKYSSYTEYRFEVME